MKRIRNLLWVLTVASIVMMVICAYKELNDLMFIGLAITAVFFFATMLLSWLISENKEKKAKAKTASAERSTTSKAESPSDKYANIPEEYRERIRKLDERTRELETMIKEIEEENKQLDSEYRDNDRKLAEIEAEFDRKVSELPLVEIDLTDAPALHASPADMPAFRHQRVKNAEELDALFPIAIVDVETTGLSPWDNEIIEISAVKLDSGYNVISAFSTLVKPESPIPDRASAVNHITDDMVAGAPSFASIRESFSDFIRGCTLAGHNLMKFDLEFLYANGVELPKEGKYIDTLIIARRLLDSPRSEKYDEKSGDYVRVEDWDVADYKLDTLCDYYGIFRGQSHRSLSDCYATGLLLEHMMSGT